MTTETNAASGAAEQLAPESTEQLPELVETGVTDDTDQSDEVNSADATATEKTPEQKELERLRRQLTKRDRTQGKLHQELQAERAAREAIERRLQSQQAEGDDADSQRSDPTQGLSQEEIQRLIDQRAQDITRVQRLNEKANAIYEQGVKKFKDFDASVKAVVEEVPLFSDSGPTPLMKALMNAPEPHVLLRHLGANPDLLIGMEDLSTADITWRLADINAGLKEAAKPKTSTAPPPLKPVNAASSPSAPDPKKDFGAWMAWRNEQTHKR